VIPVRGTLSFWAEVDGIPANDPLLDEIYDIAFDLAEGGPNIEGSRPTQWPFGGHYWPGYWVDLPSRAGFIGYLALEAVNGEFRIALLHLTWY